MEWAYAFKFLAGIGGKIVAEKAPGIFRLERISLSAKRKAKRSGLKIPYRDMRQLVRDLELFELLSGPSKEKFDEKAPALRQCIKTNDGIVLDQHLDKLLETIIDAYFECLKPHEAIRADGSQTRHQLSNLEVTLQKQHHDSASFSTNCSKLSSFRADEAKRLRDTWPRITGVVSSIAGSEMPAQLLSDWSRSRPDWLLDPPLDALCWLGAVSADYDADHAAQVFYDEAIQAGASPRGYWIARAVLSRGLESESSKRALQDEPDDDLCSAIVAAMDRDLDAASARIGRWMPPDAEGATLRRSIRAQIEYAQGDLDSAIREAVAGYELASGTGCALLAAQYLLEKGSQRKHHLFISDLEKALELATSAREARRRWRGDSCEAALKMVTALRLLGSPEQALAVCFAPPQGNATETEAADSRMVTERAHLAVEFGLVDEAEKVMTIIADGPAKDRLSAFLLDPRAEDTTKDVWDRALASAEDPTDALNIGMRLAHSGREISWPSWLLEQFPVETSETTLISELFRDTPGALQKARAKALESLPVAGAIVTYMKKNGDSTAAAHAAAEAGKRWNNPEFWLRAAELHAELGDHLNACDAAQSAMIAGTGAWLGARRAQIVLLEAETALGRWDRGLVAATQLLKMDEEDRSAKWAFITCQYKTGAHRAAWHSYITFGKPSPHGRNEALVWADLNSAFSPTLEYVYQARTLIEENREDEPLRAALVRSFMMATADKTGELEAAEVQKVVQGFLVDFPDSTLFHSVPFDKHDPLAFFDPYLEDIKAKQEALRPVGEGKLPLGFASAVTQRNYAEVCLIQRPIFAGNQASHEREIQYARESLNNVVILDSSALATLSILDPEIADQFLGLFMSLKIPSAVLHDAQMTTRQFTNTQSLNIGVGHDGRPLVTNITEEENHRRLTRSMAMVSIAERLTREVYPTLTLFAEMQDSAHPHEWLLAADLAGSTGTALWCDDKVLRDLASSSGIRTFGTPALIELLRRDSHWTAELEQQQLAWLIHNSYVGIPFDEQIMELAATLDSWRPSGAALAIAWAPIESDTATLVRFVLGALRNSFGDPSAVEGWVEAASRWLLSIAPSPQSGSSNLALWFANLLSEAWVSSSTLPHVLKGIRAAGNDESETSEMVSTVLGSFYSHIAKKSDHVTAVEYIKELIQLAPERDRSLVLQRIIVA